MCSKRWCERSPSQILFKLDLYLMQFIKWSVCGKLFIWSLVWSLNSLDQLWPPSRLAPSRPFLPVAPADETSAKCAMLRRQKRPEQGTARDCGRRQSPRYDSGPVSPTTVSCRSSSCVDHWHPKWSQLTDHKKSDAHTDHIGRQYHAEANARVAWKDDVSLFIFIFSFVPLLSPIFDPYLQLSFLFSQFFSMCSFSFLFSPLFISRC